MHIYIEVIKKDTKEGKRERGKWLHNLDKINIKLHLLKEQKAQEGFLLLIYGLDSVWYLRLILFTKSGKSRDLLHLIWIWIWIKKKIKNKQNKQIHGRINWMSISPTNKYSQTVNIISHVHCTTSRIPNQSYQTGQP